MSAAALPLTFGPRPATASTSTALLLRPAIRAVAGGCHSIGHKDHQLAVIN
jgi:hypothetical protein